jgi:hypothetical protein
VRARTDRHRSDDEPVRGPPRRSPRAASRCRPTDTARSPGSSFRVHGTSCGPAG